jgi:hypothetical protein
VPHPACESRGVWAHCMHAACRLCLHRHWTGGILPDAASRKEESSPSTAPVLGQYQCRWPRSAMISGERCRSS